MGWAARVLCACTFSMCMASLSTSYATTMISFSFRAGSVAAVKAVPVHLMEVLASPITTWIGLTRMPFMM